MKMRRDIEAEQLDAYLADLQRGRPAQPPADVPGADADFLAELAALAAAQEPDPAATRELETRLRAAARKRAAATQSNRSERGVKMNRGFAYLAAGALVLVAVFAVIVLLGGSGLRPIPPNEQIAGRPTETPAIVEPTATAALQPTQPAPSVAPTTVPATPVEQQTAVPATPEPAAPVWPAEPPKLALLALLMGSGYGGGGSGSQNPPAVGYELAATLPAGPQRLTVYGRPAELLTPDKAELVAQGWGLTPAIYQPLWMATGQSLDQFGPRAYVAVDGPVQLSLDGTEQLNYWDRRAGDAWCPVESLLPPAEQAAALAIDFLQVRNLLPPLYTVDASYYVSSGVIRFFEQLEGGWSVTGPFAVVSLRAGGQIGAVTYDNLRLQSLGEYTIISAEQAWALVSAGDSSGRVWYSSLQTRSEQPCPPAQWARSYPAGQRVDLFGPLSVLWPLDPDGQFYMRMNGLVLRGADLAALADAYQALRESSGDSEAPMHVWGVVEPAGAEQALQVEGWDAAPVAPAFWTGSIQRQGDQGTLLTDDGQSLPLPALPADLPDGQRVYVHGGLWNGRLEWGAMQAYLEDAGVPAPQPAVIRAVVEQVELVYYASPVARLAQELVANYGYRSVQPVWRFSGHTDQGTAFEITVQAVAESELAR